MSGNNHPNREWRARAVAAGAAWAKGPGGAGTLNMACKAHSRDALRAALVNAFTAGFEGGRNDRKTKAVPTKSYADGDPLGPGGNAAG